MDILWILVQIISPIFGFVYALALAPWRLSRRVTITIASILISVLTVINFFSIKNMYPIVAVFPAFDIIYRIGNIFLIVMTALFLIQRLPMRTARLARLAFTALSVVVCILVVDTIAITIRTLFGRYPMELICELLLYPLMMVVVIQIRKPFLEVILYMKNSLWFLCVVPAVLVAAILMQISFPVPLEQHPENIPVALMLCSIVIVVYGLIFYLFRTLCAQSSMEQNTQAMKLYVSSLEHQNEIVIQNAHETTMFRHDMRHAIQMMSACANDGDMEAIKGLLRRLDRNVSERITMNTITVVTGYKLLDTALSYYANLAKESGIDISIDMEPIDSVAADKTEFAVVLSNALENAVHACEEMSRTEKRIVRMDGRRCGNQFFLEIANTCVGVVDFDPDTELPVRNIDGHGLGSQSIAFFAQKYGAILGYQQIDNWFYLRILI